MYYVYPCSEKAKDRITTYEDKLGIDIMESVDWRRIYPWRYMYIGYSFAVPFKKCDEKTLRVNAVKAGKKLGKKFTVIKHIEHCVYEVARIG